MNYHDNEVQFGSDDINSYIGGCKLVSGKYKVGDFSVTSGQDPNGNIYTGLEVVCGANGIFTFKVGRSGSSTVANWFNSRIPASNTTFNHAAGVLNFAFIGILELTLTGGVLGAETHTYRFLDVAIAQGHSGATNNWWFGGKYCTYSGNNTVLGKGVDTAGPSSEMTMSFVRGGGALDRVNRVGFAIYSFLNTENWMGRLEGTRRLDQIVMPGSHDAGMSVLSHCAPPGFAEPATKTQQYSIGTQLSMGSRYFDIRVDYDYNELVTYHRTDAWGCNGQTLSSVLNQVRDFIKAYPSETAILKFSHIRDFGPDHVPAVTKGRIELFLDLYSDSIYVNNSNQTNLAALSLDAVRGKMVLVFDYDEHINAARGRFRYRDGSSPSYNIVVYDKYSNTNNYDDMKNDQLNKWGAHGGLGAGFLFLLSWTLTPTALDSTRNLAGKANSFLPLVLKDKIISVRGSKPNIVYIDFVDSFIASIIIQYNFMD